MVGWRWFLLHLSGAAASWKVVFCSSLLKAGFSPHHTVADGVAACRGSPTSQKVTFEQLRRGATLDLGECLRMEMRMVRSRLLLVMSQAGSAPHGAAAVCVGCQEGRGRLLSSFHAF